LLVSAGVNVLAGGDPDFGAFPNNLDFGPALQGGWDRDRRSFCARPSDIIPASSPVGRLSALEGLA